MTKLHLFLTSCLLVSFLRVGFSSDINADMTVDEMQTVATQILNDLKAAKGFLPLEKPIIKVEKLSGGQRLAVMNREDGIISLAIETFVHCQNMGSDAHNALAFIIGHELGHYIHGHGQVSHHRMAGRDNASRAFAGEFDGPPSGDAPSDTAPSNNANLTTAITEFSKTNEEAQADFEGAFLGYLAGYEPSDAGMRLLDAVYKDPDMGLTNIKSGYPTLAERKNIVQLTKDDLSKTTPLFEMAKYLTLMGQYSDAIPFLEQITEKFRSREIYNNIGVLLVLETLINIKEPLTHFEFPLTFDAEFRAPHPPHQMVAIASPDMAALQKFPICELGKLQIPLAKAEEYFYKAIGLDYHYATAYLNLSIAHSLKALLYNEEICKSARKEEYALAISSVYRAEKEAIVQLNGFFLEHYNFTPSEKTIVLGYPIEPVAFLNPADFSEISITENREGGETVTLVQTVRYPFWKEIFNVANYANVDHSAFVDTFTTVHSRWNTPDHSPPPAGILYSNIHLQIDLVKILMGEEMVDKKFATRGRSESNENFSPPFTRALELNNNNEMAKRNLIVFQINQPLGQFSRNTTRENFIVKHKTKTVLEEFRNINSWDISSGAIESTQLSAIADTMNFMPVENHTISNTTQFLKYEHGSEFEFYYNSTEFSSVKRKERSMILTPSTFESLNISATNTVKINDLNDDVQSKLGEPSNRVNLKDGTLEIYQTSAASALYRFAPFEGDPNEIFIDGNLFVKINEHEGNLSARVDLKETIQDGFILHLDGQNKIRGWSLYHKEIMTRP